MTDTTRALPMPSVVRLLAAQVTYQARLLASGRAVTIGIGFPVILLIASHTQGTRTTAADVARYAVFGLTLTAWNTYGVRLVAAREAGVLKRWRATPLPRWCYFLGRIAACVIVAAIAVAVVSTKDPEHFKTTPGGYFHGMVAKHLAGELHLERTLWALRRAMEPDRYAVRGRDRRPPHRF